MVGKHSYRVAVPATGKTGNGAGFEEVAARSIRSYRLHRRRLRFFQIAIRIHPSQIEFYPYVLWGKATQMDSRLGIELVPNLEFPERFSLHLFDAHAPFAVASRFRSFATRAARAPSNEVTVKRAMP